MQSVNDIDIEIQRAKIASSMGVNPAHIDTELAKQRLANRPKSQVQQMIESNQAAAEQRRKLAEENRVELPALTSERADYLSERFNIPRQCFVTDESATD